MSTDTRPLGCDRSTLLLDIYHPPTNSRVPYVAMMLREHADEIERRERGANGGLDRTGEHLIPGLGKVTWEMKE